MAEISRITIAFEGDTQAFEDIEAAAEQTAESILQFNQQIASSYEILEKAQSAFAESIVKGGEEVSTFAKNAELIIKQPLPLPIIPPPQEFIEDPIQSSVDLFEEYNRLVKENRSTIDAIADALHTIIRAYEELLPVQGALQLIASSIAAAFAAVLLAIGAITAGQFLLLLTAIAGAFFIINGGLEQLGKISEFVFKQVSSALTLTEEEAQKAGDRLKEAVENQPDTFPDLPPVELKLKLSPVFENIESLLPPELQRELEEAEIITPELDKKILDFIRENQQLTSELKNGKEAVVEYVDEIKILEGAIAMAGTGFVAGVGAQSEFLDATEKTAEELDKQVKQVENADASLQNLNSQNKDLVNTQGQVNQVVGESGSEFQDAGAGVKEYGDALEQVEGTGGGFFQGIKDGFREFAESVQSNSELAANFFADTLSQMSQNFSDLFFNVIKGNFDDLADLAGQAFDAILRSFLDLVAAIATRQIVISIAGAFGASTKGGIGSDYEDLNDETEVLSLDKARMEKKRINTEFPESEYRLAA
jgi:hypothetical protein